jgi:hypothetical protein
MDTYSCKFCYLWVWWSSEQYSFSSGGAWGPRNHNLFMRYRCS